MPNGNENSPKRAILLTTGEFASEIGVTLRTVQRWLAKGTIAPAGVTKGGHRRWTREQVIRCLENKGISLGSNSETTGSGTSTGTTPPTGELTASVFARKMRVKRRIATSRSSRKDKAYFEALQMLE